MGCVSGVLQVDGPESSPGGSSSQVHTPSRPNTDQRGPAEHRASHRGRHRLRTRMELDSLRTKRRETFSRVGPSVIHTHTPWCAHTITLHAAARSGLRFHRRTLLPPGGRGYCHTVPLLSLRLTGALRPNAPVRHGTRCEREQIQQLMNGSIAVSRLN